MITNKIRSNTLHQILEVIEISKTRYSSGSSITSSINDGVKEVSKRYRTTYQTIEDGCRRRLGFNDIEEFKSVLMEYFNGNPDKIISVLRDHTNIDLHGKINDFFRNGKVSSIIPVENKHKNISENNSEVFSFRLDNETSKKLKMLVSYKGISISEWISNTVKNNVQDDLEELLKKLVEKL